MAESLLELARRLWGRELVRDRPNYVFMHPDVYAQLQRAMEPDCLQWLGFLGRALTQCLKRPGCRHHDCRRHPEMAWACMEARRAARRASNGE